MKRTISLLAVLLLAVPVGASTAEPPVVDADGIDLVEHFPFGDPQMPGANSFFASGTDLAFHGDYVYAAEQNRDLEGGIHIIDVSDPNKPFEAGFVDCAGYQNDVAVVDEGIVALGYHNRTSADWNDCPDAVGGGVTLFDVSDLENIRMIGTTPPLPGGTHTLTVSPDGNFIYASPGGIANGGGVQQIIDVTVREPEGGVYPVHTFKPNETGCHDFAFFSSVDDVPMGVCVGLAESQIWDLTDPTSPEIVSSLTNPLIDFMHSAAITDDGQFLVVGDEAIVANECVGGPTGAMYAFDISTPELPIPRGYFAINRAHEDAALNSVNPGASPPGMGREHWCTAHIYDFLPGTNIMVSSWYSGGINVIDWGEDFLAPREVAHYRTDGEYRDSEVTNYWSAYWHEGRIYANDRVRGLDALRWNDLEDALGKDAAEATPEELTTAVRSLPSTDLATWRSGVFSSVPTPAQQLVLAARGTLGLDDLGPYSCRLALTEQ